MALKGSEALNNFAVANGMAQSMNLTPLGDGKPPIREDLGRYQMYAEQAMRLGLSPTLAESAVRQVKENGGLDEPTRERVQAQALASNSGWHRDRLSREIETLENRAGMLPDEIKAVGAMPILVRLPAQAEAPAIRVVDVQEPPSTEQSAPARSRLPLLRPPSRERSE